MATSTHADKKLPTTEPIDYDPRPVPAALADDAMLAPGRNLLGFGEACAAADCVAETLARLADRYGEVA